MGAYKVYHTGEALPQFENVAASLPAWLGVRETIQVDASLKADASLYSLCSRIRKEGHAWHLSWDFPGRRAELSITVSPGQGSPCWLGQLPAVSSVAEPCPPLPPAPSFLPPSSLPLALRVKGVAIQCGPSPLKATLWILFFKYGNMQVPSRRGLDWCIKPETNKLVKV